MSNFCDRITHMERSEGQRLEAESEQSATTVLRTLYESKRQNSLIRQLTPIEIHASKTNTGFEYSMLIARPLRSNDLEAILLAGSTEEKKDYSKNITIAYLDNDDEDEFGGGVKINLQVLGRLIDSPDDSLFLKNVSSRIRPHHNAWENFISNSTFGKRLVQERRNYNSPYFETAKTIINLMRINPEFQSYQQRMEGANNRMLLERFDKIPSPYRKWILDSEMKRYGDERKSEEKRRISMTDGIQFEIQKNGEDWYVIGNDLPLDKIDDETFYINNGKNQAVVKSTDEGFDIYPRSAYLLPTLTWKNENGKRKLVVPSKFKKDSLRFPTPDNKYVNYVYKIDERLLSNPIAGLVTLQYILDYQPDKMPAHKVPEMSVIRKDEILASDLIKKAERLVS